MRKTWTKSQSHRATKNQREDSCSLRSYFAHVLHSVRISNVDSLIWVNGIREMLKFKFSNNIRQDDPFVSSQTSDEVKTFWVSIKNRTLPGMNIHEETWVCKKKVNSVLHSKSCLFFIYKNFSTFFSFFAFLDYLGTMRTSLFFEFETFCLWKYYRRDCPLLKTSKLFHNALSCFEAFLVKLCK